MRPLKEWHRGLGLLACVLLTPVFSTHSLVAMSFLIMTLTMGAKRPRVVLAVGVATLLILIGTRDAIWFVERAWAMIAAGWFAFFTLRRPAWTLSGRALAAVAAAALTVTAAMLARPGAWSSFDIVVAERLGEALDRLFGAISFVRGGEGIGPTLTLALQATLEAQLMVFPALTAVSTVAALSVTSWLYMRLLGSDRTSLKPLATFRFNDHWLWPFLTGLAVLALGGLDSPDRLALNVVVFVGALFALRGMAVISFLSGRYRRIAYSAMALVGLFAWPGLLGAALVVGLADVWIDPRAENFQTGEAT